MFLVNSRLSPFPATRSPLSREREQLRGSPFFQRYGVNLPSSLTEVRSLTLGVVPRPTGVGLRYGQSHIWLEAFLGGLGGHDFRQLAPARARRHASARRIFLARALRAGSPACPFAGFMFPTASPLRSITMGSGAGASALLAIAYDDNVLGLGPD